MSEVLFQAIRVQDIDAIQKILASNPNSVNAKDARGFNPLLFASYLGNKEIAETLLAYNPEIDAKDQAGNTALMGVCFKGNVEIAQLLIDKGANVNETNMNGTTPLSFAATFEQKEMVVFLLKNKADSSLKDKQNMSPADHAKEKGFVDIAKLLEG